MTTELPSILGTTCSEEEAHALLQKERSTYNAFLSLSMPHREEIIRFISGKESLCITYDAIFEKIVS